jgi:uncharacterized protein YqcC (DUF446 family)
MGNKSKSRELFTLLANKIAEIEAEMVKADYWQTSALPEEAYDFEQPFAMDTMPFAQWLQFILIPRVNEILQQAGELPAESMLGVQAMREFDGELQAGRLVTLLSEFDELVNQA